MLLLLLLLINPLTVFLFNKTESGVFVILNMMLPSLLFTPLEVLKHRKDLYHFSFVSQWLCFFLIPILYAMEFAILGDEMWLISILPSYMINTANFLPAIALGWLFRYIQRKRHYTKMEAWSPAANKTPRLYPRNMKRLN